MHLETRGDFHEWHGGGQTVGWRKPERGRCEEETSGKLVPFAALYNVCDRAHG